MVRSPRPFISLADVEGLPCGGRWRLTTRLLHAQGAPWGPESPSGARPVSPAPGVAPVRQRGFYSEVLDAELEPTSQTNLKQVRLRASRHTIPCLPLLA